MSTKDQIEDVLDLSADSIDTCIRVLTDSKILDEVPIAGNLLRIIKAGASVPDLLFAYKAAKVFEGVNKKTTKTERENFAETLKKDKSKRERLYGEIFLRIDKFEEISKADLFAKIFSSFIRNKIRERDFVLLSDVLGRLTVAELGEFSRDFFIPKTINLRVQYNSIFRPDELHNEILVAARLMTRSLTSKYSSNAGVTYEEEYEITDLGKLYSYIAEDFDDYFRLLDESEQNLPRYQYEKYLFLNTYDNWTVGSSASGGRTPRKTDMS